MSFNLPKQNQTNKILVKKIPALKIHSHRGLKSFFPLYFVDIYTLQT